MRNKKPAEHKWYRVGDLVKPLLLHLCHNRRKPVQLTGIVIKIKGPTNPTSFAYSLDKKVYTYEIACICPLGCRPTAIFRRGYAPELSPVQLWKKKDFLKAYRDLYAKQGVLKEVEKLLNR